MAWQMHMMTGLEAMAAIRKEPPEAKIIILTTYTGDAKNAKKLGARAYLLKSELDKELLGTIRSVHTKNRQKSGFNPG
jgi:two-component system NarL family response regulator